ncbi:MAG: apolipoprotein N-acyltransferase [Arcobacteraceae bacterium]
MFTYKSVLTALCFSFFLYSDYFGIKVEFINTLFAIMGIVALFYLKKKELFATGFLISVLWFWWVGYSFVYYDLSYLIPLAITGISLVYGVLFYFIGFFNTIVYKILYIILLSFINPFGFNWFKIELPFINSYLGTSKIEYFIIVASIGLFIQYRAQYKKQSIVALCVVFVSLYIYNISNTFSIEKPNLKIYEYQTNIDQEKKWKKEYQQNIVYDNFSAINNAIKNSYDLIVLPETAFPLVLNKTASVNEELLKLSYHISIVTGSLYKKDGLYYNSTYFYENGKRKVAHKVVLVPFGEAVPLPEKIRNLINDLFYDGAKDYETAKEPTTFTIKGIKFRNAICYEITTDDIYQNLDTSYIIATSNNAWFSPSIQTNLQNLLMKYYQNKYKVYYINVTNH